MVQSLNVFVGDLLTFVISARVLKCFYASSVNVSNFSLFFVLFLIWVLFFCVFEEVSMGDGIEILCCGSVGF